MEHTFHSVYEIGDQVYQVRVAPNAGLQVVKVQIKNIICVLETGKVIYLFSWADNPSQEMQATGEYLYTTIAEAFAARPRLAEETLRNRHEPYLEGLDKRHAEERTALVDEMKRIRESADAPVDETAVVDMTMAGALNTPVAPVADAQAAEAATVAEAPAV